MHETKTMYEMKTTLQENLNRFKNLLVMKRLSSNIPFHHNRVSLFQWSAILCPHDLSYTSESHAECNGIYKF